ncbi:hypothetical protein COV06_01855 [Candidatus Uhrbacteria bacterium CG10_big_fil_rev_8_21_14_0_10_50_16]|uniref:DDH domain-containing protein n=1 Tax=Candidatus Uhrbacteria bacterium CG10_big_fil_rev_8_21_14_0_10_50_16 TaxID=1975039 RepID=A0A2H0RMM5_9BACT|nr:MAG: hypothetical protein COV06_01855 [Candidatus Uhrbacteria bacterium CG10_big_fil_rev_8_21_14_0_10_50_16]
MTMIETFERAKRLIDPADHVLLLTDERSDGDTFGSSLAFAEYLRGQNKRVTHVAGSAIPISLRFLPGIEQATEDRSVIQNPTIDLVIVFDSSRESYVKDILSLLHRSVSLILFDHHASNSLFGEVNVVHSDVSSTCEVVFEYLRHHNIPLSRDMAKCLMTGILTDTGMFSNPVTNSDAIDRASALLIQGGNIKTVIDNIVRQMGVEQLQLWGILLSRLVYHREFDTAILWVKQEDYDLTGTGSEIIGELHDYLQATLHVKVIFFLKELSDGMVKVSMRSINNDVSRIAKQFTGGGGHPGACGFSVKGVIKIVDDCVCVV